MYLRRPCVRLRVRASAPRTPCCAPCSAPATTSSCRTTPTAAPTGCSPASPARGGSSTTTCTSPTSTRSARRSARADQGGLGRDADQPAARHRRHRGARADRARRRRAARRRQHLRHAVPAEPARPRRRRRRALDDQVRGGHSDVVGGALVVAPGVEAPWMDGVGDVGAGVASGSRFHQNAMGAVAGAVRRLARACAASRRSPSGWSGTATTPSGSSEFLVGHPRVAPGVLPGPARAPGPRHRGRSRCGGSAAWSASASSAARRTRSTSASATEVFTLGESLGGVESRSSSTRAG